MPSIIHTHTPNTQGGFRGNASQLRPPSSKFQCREFVLDDEDYGQVVAFECTFHGCVESSTKMESSSDTKSLPQQQQQQQQTTLTFVCREPSCGVLVGEETAACKSEEDEQPMDPNFFDAGYTAAGKTGFQVWPGSRIVVEAMLLPQLSDVPQLQFWQQWLMSSSTQHINNNPLRVLELGAGVGMVGACLAQAGAHVLLTDLPTLVEESLLPNLQRNATQTITLGEWKEGEGSKISPLMWMVDDEECNSATQPQQDNDSTGSSLSHNLFQIGHGWAAAAPLDWSKPVEEQLTTLQCQSIDVIVASDCVWLVSMLEGLLTTVETIFQQHHHQEHQQRQSDDNPNFPRLLLSFQRRDTAASSDNSGEESMFTTVDRVLAELHAKHWQVECLSWHPVTYVDPETGEKDDTKEVFLFDVRPYFPSHSP